MIKLKRKILYRHILIWLLLISYIIYTDVVTGTNISKLVYVLLFTSNFATHYYINLLVVFPFLYNKKRIIFIFSFLLTMCFFVFSDYVLIKEILPYFYGHTSREFLTGFIFIKSSILLFSFVAFSSLASYLNWRSIERYKEAISKEKRIISTELNFLKNQFNSHLTFNFLNFCYSKMLRYSPKAANSVEIFSEMLHYSLKIKSNEYVSLNDEINYLENFINIQKCISTNIFVDFKIGDNVNEHKIMPMILSVFVENSFKHGVINDSNYPIRLELTIKNNNILFIIENKKKNQKKITCTGIGIENIKQTLHLFYKKNHLLEITETNSTYNLKLELKSLTLL